MFTTQDTQLTPKRVNSETFEPIEFYEFFTLQPRLVESLYHLFHFTKDSLYQEMAYNIAINIEKHCLLKNGYVGILNVNHLDQGYFGVMDSKFISETLKYLYLIFDDEYYFVNLGGHLIKLEKQ